MEKRGTFPPLSLPARLRIPTREYETVPHSVPRREFPHRGGKLPFKAAF